MKIAQWGLVILLASPLASARARQAQQAPPPDQSSSSGQQDNSLAAAARRAQEQKKDQPKAAKVWDNDTIPSTPGGVNVVGQSGEAGSAPPAAGEREPKPAAPPTPEQKAALESSLNSAKAKLESLKTDLDIATRKYALDEQMYMGKPDYQKDKDGADALQAEKDDISAKQQELADLQKQIADLQSQADAAGPGSN